MNYIHRYYYNLLQLLRRVEKGQRRDKPQQVEKLYLEFLAQTKDINVVRYSDPTEIKKLVMTLSNSGPDYTMPERRIFMRFLVEAFKDLSVQKNPSAMDTTFKGLQDVLNCFGDPIIWSRKCIRGKGDGAVMVLHVSSLNAFLSALGLDVSELENGTQFVGDRYD